MPNWAQDMEWNESVLVRTPSKRETNEETG